MAATEVKRRWQTAGKCNKGDTEFGGPLPLLFKSTCATSTSGAYVPTANNNDEPERDRLQAGLMHDTSSPTPSLPSS